MIALDEEEQNRRENETVSASRAKIEGKGKDEPAKPDSQESWQKLAGRTIVAGDRLQEISLIITSLALSPLAVINLLISKVPFPCFRERFFPVFGISQAVSLEGM